MNKDDIIAKIKRLFRLSRSDNLNEAAAAAAAAQRLMARYQIDMVTVGDIDEDGTVRVGAAMDEDGLYQGINIPLWVQRLASNLADLNACATILQIKERERIVGIVGSPHAISCVRYMFDYLRREIIRLATVHGAKHSARHRLKRPSTKWRNDFKIGATDAVIIRMRDARDEIFGQASGRTLMRIDSLHRAAKEWVAEHVTLPPPALRVPKVDQTAYITGRVAGKDIQLRAEIALPEEK